MSARTCSLIPRDLSSVNEGSNVALSLKSTSNPEFLECTKAYVLYSFKLRLNGANSTVFRDAYVQTQGTKLTCPLTNELKLSSSCFLPKRFLCSPANPDVP